MSTLRLLNVSIVALAAGVSMRVKPQLPAVMALHWNAYGQADGFGPRGIALFMMPAVMLFLLGLFAIIPKISSRGRQIEQMRGVYDGIVMSTLVFLFVIHGVVIAVGLGHPLPIERVVPFAVSLLFVALGGFIGRVQPNAFVGMRTPWTMSSPEVWKKTHRFAARLFVVGGLGLALACLAGAGFWVVFAGFMALGLLPVVYSAFAAAQQRS